MKQLKQTLALCLILMITQIATYGIYYYTGSKTLLILNTFAIAILVFLYILGGILWLMDYIKNGKL